MIHNSHINKNNARNLILFKQLTNNKNCIKKIEYMKIKDFIINRSL